MTGLSSNGLYRTSTLFAVELHPSTVADVEGGVKEQLNAHLLRYVDEFDGVLVAYSNVKILTKQPIIHPYFPYFHLDVRADVLVFKPTPGMMLVARVNHLGEDYISALTLGVFNVTIPSRAVMPELHFLREENKWIHKLQPQHQIQEHSYVVFRVEDVKDNGGFFQITGSMRDPATGAADFLHPGVKLPEPPEGWPADTVGSPPRDEDGDVDMEPQQPSGRGFAALAAATGAAATTSGGAAATAGAGAKAGTPAANGTAAKPVKGNKEHGGKRQRESEAAEAVAAAAGGGEKEGKRRKKDGAGPSGAAAATPAAAAAAATPEAGGAGGTEGKKDKDKSEKKRDKSERKKEKKAAAEAAAAAAATPAVATAVAGRADGAPSDAGHARVAAANGGNDGAAGVSHRAEANGGAPGTMPGGEESKKKKKKDKGDKDAGDTDKKEKKSDKKKEKKDAERDKEGAGDKEASKKEKKEKKRDKEKKQEG